jgi:hypothetical protein
VHASLVSVCWGINDMPAKIHCFLDSGHQLSTRNSLARSVPSGFQHHLEPAHCGISACLPGLSRLDALSKFSLSIESGASILLGWRGEKTSTSCGRPGEADSRSIESLVCRPIL